MSRLHRVIKFWPLVIFILFVLLIVVPKNGVLWGQGSGFNSYQTTGFTATGFAPSIQQNSLIKYHQLIWTVTGAPATCTVSLDSSVDGVSFTVGGIIAGQTCTTSGTSVVTGLSQANFVRVNLSALTGGTNPTVQIVYEGWAYNPSGGGGLPAGLTFVAPTLTVSVAGSGNGQLALSGNTSGTATFTAPAAAGTTTNPVIASNTIQFPPGNTTNPSIANSTASTTGWNFNSGGNNMDAILAGNPFYRFASGSFFGGSGQVIGFSSNANVTLANADTGLSRGAAGLIMAGNGTSGNQTGKFGAAGFQSLGTTFTSNAGCGDTTLTGGASAGKYTSVTAGTCTTVITMGSAVAASTGWSCTATDLTTAADAGNIHQTATSTTTASLNEGTVAANDVIQFSCMAY